jgi:hypothetical protein
MPRFGTPNPMCNLSGATGSYLNPWHPGGLFDRSIADRTARKAARTKPIRRAPPGGRIDRPGVKWRANEANPPRRVGAARRDRVACRTRANEANPGPGAIASMSCRPSFCVVLGAIVARTRRERSQSGRESNRGNCSDRESGRGGPATRERSQPRGPRAGPRRGESRANEPKPEGRGGGRIHSHDARADAGLFKPEARVSRANEANRPDHRKRLPGQAFASIGPRFSGVERTQSGACRVRPPGRTTNGGRRAGPRG